MRFASLSLLRAASITAFACVLVAPTRDAAALHVGSTMLINESGEICSISPDVAFFNGQFDVSYTSSIVDCSVPTLRALRLWRVDASMVARLRGRIAPTITGTQVIGRLAVAPLPEPQLIVAALTIPNATSLSAHVYSALPMGAGPTAVGTLPNPSSELIDGSLDCFGSRCDFVSVERVVNVASRRVRIATSPFSYDGMAAPRMINAVRASVVETSVGPWDFFTNNTSTMPWVNPAGVISATVFMPSVVTGAVALRSPGGTARVFAAVDGGGSERVHLLLPPFAASSGNFNYSERVTLTDADNFVPSNSYALASVAPGSNSVRVVLFQDSTGAALTGSPAVISPPAGWTARTARIATTRGAIEGRALVVYELRNASDASQVWAAFVTCSQDNECDDGDANTTDRCGLAGDLLRACQHFAFSGADAALPVDAAVDADVVMGRDSGVASDASRDSGAEIDASFTDAASMDGAAHDGEATADGGSMDAAAMDGAAQDAGVLVENGLRITGGSCDCRAGVRPVRDARWALVWAAAASLVTSRRRRSR